MLLLIIEKKLRLLKSPIFCRHFYFLTFLEDFLLEQPEMKLSLSSSKIIAKIALLILAVEGHKICRNNKRILQLIV